MPGKKTFFSKKFSSPYDDELKGKFEEAGRDGSRLYIIGIQV